MHLTVPGSPAIGSSARAGISGNDSREEVEHFIALLRSGSDVLDGLIKELETIRATKKATRPEVLELMKREKVKA
jgi:preprotein translocase subunit SecD